MPADHPQGRSRVLADSLTNQRTQALLDYLANQRSHAHRVLHHMVGIGRPFLLRSDICDAMTRLCSDDPLLCDTALAETLAQCQEVALDSAWIYLALRRSVGRWDYLRIHLETMDLNEVAVADFLRFKERLASGGQTDAFALEIDMAPFYREQYKLREEASIGRGVEFLNRRLSSQLFDEIGQGDQRLLEFLRVHNYRGQQLMVNDSISDMTGLRNALRQVMIPLRRRPSHTPYAELAGELRAAGFEAGWGDDVGRLRETMGLLLDVLEAPSPETLEAFLARVPMIFSIAIISPQGWFGQSNVIGRPDTGGQVVYVLDQVRALEREMQRRLLEQGIDIAPRVVVVTRLIPEAQGTMSNQRQEHIAGTRHAVILRVPFRTEGGEVLADWVSRFRLWPYLEDFALDAEQELLAELGGRPDLIIGNYSDGALVASLLSQRLGVTQCNIAHALEKTRHLLSDLYWRENDARFHFAAHFTADLIAMNTADFIITSTYQEIAGTADSLGQYESYMHFTMPGLYRVVNGVDVYDPKFNIVAPGCDEAIYFPYTETGRRLNHLHGEIDALIFGAPRPGESRGQLAAPERPLLFAMAQLDGVKNITGLVDWYARHQGLREQANLLIVAGHLDPAHTADAEEREQIGLLHGLMDRYGLDDSVRWVGRRLDKPLAGEVYRCIADRRGVFVQPARFEAFGLTILEAMACGLPTFATRYGGPLEIIEDGRSGFHIDPNHGEESAARIHDFLAAAAADGALWEAISEGGLARIAERYTWAHYAERMMTLSRVYGFWKHVTDMERAETRRYLEMFYGLQFRPLARAVGR